MKVLICDHADCMMPDHALEIETLRAGLGEDVEVEVLEYEDDKRRRCWLPDSFAVDKFFCLGAGSTGKYH